MESIQASFKASPLFKSDASRILSGLVEIYPSRALIVSRGVEFSEELNESTSLWYKEKAYKDIDILASTDINFVDQIWTQSHGTDVIVHISSSDLKKPILEKNLGTDGSIVKEFELLAPGTVLNIQHILLTYDIKMNGITVKDLPMGLLTVDPVSMEVKSQSYESEAQSLTIHTVLKVGGQGGLEVNVKGCLGNLANIMRGLGAMIETFEKSIAESQQSKSISKADLTRLLNQQASNIPYIKDGYWMLNGKAIAKVDVIQTGGASTDEYEAEYRALTDHLTQVSKDINNHIIELKTQVESYKDIIRWLLYTQFEIRKDGDAVYARRLMYPGLKDHPEFQLRDEETIDNAWLKFTSGRDKEQRWGWQRLFDVFGGESVVSVSYDANRGELLE